MAKNPTEQYVAEHLPTFVGADASDAPKAYLEFLQRTRELFAGERFAPLAMYEYVDAKNGGNFMRLRTASVVDRAEVLVPTLRARLPLHRRGASPPTFVSVLPSGRLAAARFAHGEQRVPQAKQAFVNLAAAVLVDKLVEHGADNGKGYAQLKNTQQELGLVGPLQWPPIGMHTLYASGLRAVRTLAYSGAAGGELSEQLSLLIENEPQFYELHRRTVQASETPAAGLVNTLVSGVANRTVVADGDALAAQPAHVISVNELDDAARAGVRLN